MGRSSDWLLLPFGGTMANVDLAQHVADSDPHSQYVKEDLATGAGDLLVGIGNGLVSFFPPDSPGFILYYMQDGIHPSGLRWLPASTYLLSLLKHKGDILTTDGVGHLVVIPVGSDGQVLTANASASGGLIWQTASTVCPERLDFSDSCDSQYVAVI